MFGITEHKQKIKLSFRSNHVPSDSYSVSSARIGHTLWSLVCQASERGAIKYIIGCSTLNERITQNHVFEAEVILDSLKFKKFARKFPICMFWMTFMTGDVNTERTVLTILSISDRVLLVVKEILLSTNL